MEEKGEKKIKKSTREERGNFADMNLALCENWHQCQNWHQFQNSHQCEVSHSANFRTLVRIFLLYSSSIPLLLLFFFYSAPDF